MNPDIVTLGIALGLGLLVGLQRERFQSRIAGMRTFCLISLFGALSGLIARHFDQAWLIAAGVIAIAILLAVANILKHQDDEPDVGQTTEIAALLMYAIGAYLMLGNLTIGVVAGAVLALLLYLKKFFAEQVARLDEKDLQALMVFIAVSLVVLPILPTNTFGPYDVLSLTEIWLMVVLIVGISVVGYFAYKWLGKDMGAGLSGILGGLVSSTATTVTYARQTKENPALYRLAGFVVTTASAVAFVRVLIEVSIVAPKHMPVVAPPILTILGVIALISIGLFFATRRQTHEPVPDPQNPAQFKTALIFAVLYAVVLMLIAFAKDALGSEGLYAVSILSGLTDMDAITLSLANMMNDGRMLPEQGWKLILTAGLANLLFKMGMVVGMGNRQLLCIVVPVFVGVIAAGVVILLVW